MCLETWKADIKKDAQTHHTTIVSMMSVLLRESRTPLCLPYKVITRNFNDKYLIFLTKQFSLETQRKLHH